MPSPGERIDWLRKHVINPRTREPIELLPFQTDFIEGVYADGILSAGFSLPRKNGKTALLAGLALAELDLNTDADVIVGATKMKQASRPSGIFGVAKTLVRLGKLPFRVSKNNNEAVIQNTATGCQIEVVSFSDQDAAQGLNPSLLVCDEFGTSFWTPERWAAAVMSMGGRGADSRVIGISTPSSLDSAMYALRQQVAQGNAPASFYWHEHSAPMDADPYDPATWEMANPALGHFLAVESIQQDTSLAEHLFRTFRLGQWVDSNSYEGWLGIDGASHWDATVASFDFDPAEPIWLGLDKSAYDDYSALVALQKDGDRWLAKCITYKPAPTIDHAKIRNDIRDFCRNFQVAAIGYDERYAVEMASDLEEEGLPMVRITQGAPLAPHYAAIHKAIAEERFIHEDDDDYRRAILSAVPRIQDGGGFTLSKNKSREKIDPAVATAIAMSVTDIQPSRVWWKF